MWKPAKYGNSTRLTKNPGQSFTTTAVLPIRPASFTVAATASSDDCLPRITSTSGIMFTGLKKCMPTKFCGRLRASASRLIEMVDVLDAMIVSSRTRPSTSASTAVLTFGFSTTASMMMSTPPKSP